MNGVNQEQVLAYGHKLYATADFLKQLDIPITVEEQTADPLFILDIPEEKADLPLDVPLIEQMAAPRLYNGCEVTSLAMILNYHGYDVTKNELAENVNVVPLTYENGLKGDPNEGFVGNMADGPGLGVYHGPMMDLARKYVGDRAVDLTGSNPDAIYQALDNSHPVWIITTSSFAPAGGFETWQTPNGEVEVTFSLHSVAVTGYEDDYVYINDPYGGKNKQVDRENFEKAWIQMGSQAIVIEE
ncbi:C39 family peptidase [Virgibacillus senegalensis]|uniref:C39 family peptidase n=1 Tax=Virgibacillus senegalensis TaxID=1499679 RepID=UPI00069D6B0A